MHTDSNLPRPEYPRPQFIRNKWLNLNGEWNFEIDNGKSGRDRKLHEAGKLAGKILVPFCPESRLSGVENKDFMNAVWYKREFAVSDEWKTGRTLIHFGAVDYETEVWINGVSAGRHRGGYTPFTFDITRLLSDGVNMIAVCAEDDLRSGLQPSGKQSTVYGSQGCFYTRTTGIWQTVWLENVPKSYISSVKYVPDPVNGCVHIDGSFIEADGCLFVVEAFFGATAVGASSVIITGKSAKLSVKLSELHLWGPGEPNLYELRLLLRKPSCETCTSGMAVNDDEIIDCVESYFGLRSVSLSDTAILINGKPLFQKLVLDQGFNPDGVYTAPTDAFLKRDIEIAMNLGFNGARLHEKIFEPRYIYWADKLGFLLWGEHANWGLDMTNPMGLERFLPEWLEAMNRDFNSPAVIGWCPFNETLDKGFLPGDEHFGGIRMDENIVKIVYNVTKMLDKSRPVIDTSGLYHIETDIFDIHDYDQDPAAFAARLDPVKHGAEPFVTFADRQKYNGELYAVTEYGGIWWNPDQQDAKAWGYGNRPKSKEEFLKRFDGLTMVLFNNNRICASCYTQLYDVEFEVNGLYTYDRRPKFDDAIVREVNMRKTAIDP